MLFNDLHADILETIFYIHVHINQGSRRSLLLTCHRWHSVAINYTSLWRSIIWCNRPLQPANPAQCDSLRGLAHLIARTGNTSFDLSLGWWPHRPTSEEINQFISSVGPNWLSRCRSFTLTRDLSNFYHKEMNDLLLRGSFDKLERLIWQYSDQGWNFELGRLIDHLGNTVPRLRELEITCVLSATSVLSQLPRILGRIRRLRVAINIPLLAWESHLTNIEHLDVCGNRELFTTLLPPHLTSLGLKGRLLVSMLPPTAMLEKLTHLTIRELEVPESRETSLYLPSLQYLSFQFTHYDPYSGTLHVEKLRELTLVDNSGAQEPILLFVPGVAPQIVNLYMYYYGLYQLQSLDYPFWIKMVELHVTMHAPNSRLAATVTIALEAGGFAPQLQCLTVRYKVGGTGGVPQSQKREWVDQLLRLMAGRVAKGMKPFERLEVGWFNELQYGYNLLEEFPEQEGVTHWTDCLRA